MQVTKPPFSPPTLFRMFFLFVFLSPVSCEKKNDDLTRDVIAIVAYNQLLQKSSGVEECLGNQERKVSILETPSLPPDPNSMEKGVVLVQIDASNRTLALDSLGRVTGKPSSYRNIKAGPNREWIKISWPVERMDELASMPGIVSVQPNFIYRAFALPDDQNFSAQWGMKNSGVEITTEVIGVPYTITTQTGIDINAPAAWDTRTDCSEIPIAVIDTGVALDHEDLVNNLWTDPDTGDTGYDSYDGDSDPYDEHGHGTHVASIIGAEGNNGTGIAGICWKAKIIPIRALGPLGEGSTASLVNGIAYALEKGARVINLSLGTDAYDALIYDAVSDARDQGVIVVAAAGNSGTDNDSSPVYPASFNLDNIISVAAIDSDGTLASFSNRGETSVDLAAPGTTILGAWPYQQEKEWSTFQTIEEGGEWSLSGNWGVEQDCYTLKVEDLELSIPALSNPGDYCSNTSASYSSTVNDEATAYFDRSGFQRTTLELDFFYDTGSDLFELNTAPGATDPFSTGGSQLTAWSGSSKGSPESGEFLLDHCSGSDCTIGFRLRAMDATSHPGVSVALFGLTGQNPSTESYEYLKGTSQSTPFVAGVAAMLLSHRPEAGVRDVILSIFEGSNRMGSLSSATCTGGMLDAKGALEALEKRLPETE